MADAPDTHSVPDLVRSIRTLEPDDQQRLLSWIESGQRHWTKAEVLWVRFRHLPADAREEVQASLDSDAG
jgi:hypothetical protein